MKLTKGFTLHWIDRTPIKVIGIKNVDKDLEKNVYCMFDTGAGNTIVDHKIVEELQLPKEQVPKTIIEAWEKLMMKTIEYMTAFHVYMVERDELLIAYALLMDLSDQHFSVLLGTEFFIEHKIVLDFSDNSIKIKK